MLPVITFGTYDVHFIDELPALVGMFPWATYSNIYVLVDANTRAYCLPMLLEIGAFKNATILEIPAGESYKTIDTCEHIWEALLHEQADRNALVVNLGGGLVSDLGGFIAGTYKRGIDFVNIPTTLLAMVDATVGAKTGINLSGIKNTLGLFNEPKAIFIHLPFLSTLDNNELLSGYAEMLKHALLSGQPHWDALTAIGPKALATSPTLIAQSLHVKKAIVEQDITEQGLRKVLNFGHSIGHAIETECLRMGQPIMHGHAVALGMVAELWLSVRLQGFPQPEFETVSNYLLGLYGSFLNIDLSLDNLAKLVGNDKKNRSKQLLFSLLRHVGQPEYDCLVSQEMLLEALVYLRGETYEV
jgi:3-dehydroquinate synthase